MINGLLLEDWLPNYFLWFTLLLDWGYLLSLLFPSHEVFLG
jgi:hypothetical protein